MPTEQEIRDRITDLEEAIDDIVSGERLVEVTTGDRHERRQEASLTQLQARLQALRDELAAVATGDATKRPRVYRASYSKGL